jgi:hypothetical protein
LLHRRRMLPEFGYGTFRTSPGWAATSDPFSRRGMIAQRCRLRK